MGAEIDLERRFSAEEAYITGSVTFEQLAAASGISSSQLRHWAATEGWQEKRREYRQAFADIRRNTVELRRRFVEKALGSLNPMDAFAISALEKLAMAAEKSAAGAPAPEPPAAGGEPVFRTQAEAVAVLKGIVENKLSRMLLQPDSVNLAAVKDVKQCLELLDKMQDKAAPDGAATDEKQPMSEERIRELREMLNL
jgi:hypothetical protein